MSKTRIEMAGRRYGRLLAIRPTEKKTANKSIYWECLCICGRTIEIGGHKLRTGHTKSCGCLRDDSRKKHQMTSTSTYSVWKYMRQRCLNPKSNRYDRYGGRGIKVCKHWSEFQHFFEDMGERPKGLTLDRIDNDGDYCRANCRWATKKEQENNKSTNVIITYKGRRLTVSEWAEEQGINYSTLFYRLFKRGWSVEKALTTPVT